MRKQYYVERAASGTVGNCLLWWRKGGKGYGCDLAEAEVFDDDSLEFVSIVMANEKYRVWPKEYIDARTSIHVDHQHLDPDESGVGGEE